MRQMRSGSMALCAVALAMVVAAGCSHTKSMTDAGSGRIHMIMGGGSTHSAMAASTASPVLADGSGRTITSAVITLSSVLARNLDGHLIDVTLDLPFAVDLVTIMQGGTVDLPIGALPAGSYDQLVVVIRSLHVVLSDGTQLDVTPPGGGWTAIVPTQPFDVVEGQVTTIHLNFHANGAFHWSNGEIDFNPEFDCQTDHAHGDDQGDD